MAQISVGNMFGVVVSSLLSSQFGNFLEPNLFLSMLNFNFTDAITIIKIPNLYMKSKSKNNVCTTVKSKSLVSGIVNL